LFQIVIIGIAQPRNMKKLATVILCLPLLFFGCKKKGCLDVNALDFDPEARTGGDCTYTKVIFYAPGDTYGAAAFKVSKIEVIRRISNKDTLIGTITRFNDPVTIPIGCSTPPDALEYYFERSDEKAVFLTRFYGVNGVVADGDRYELSPDRSMICIVKELAI
jgi:hypothetical protein